MFKLKRYSTKYWKKIIIHYSYSPDNAQAYDWHAIDKYHTVEKGWSEIGYHFGIEKINYKYEICIGRSLSKFGGHTVGQNEVAIGICCIGNFDWQTPEEELYEKLADLLIHLVKEFNINIDDIEFHSKYNRFKTCPGKCFNLEKIKQMVRNRFTLLYLDTPELGDM